MISVLEAARQSRGDGEFWKYTYLHTEEGKPRCIAWQRLTPLGREREKELAIDNR